MTQSIYFEQTRDQDITFALTGKTAIENRKFHDMSSHTVIIVADEYEDENVIRSLANTILDRGCKNIAFCGEASEEWQDIFAEADRDINGFNDLAGNADFAIMWRIEDLEYLPEEVEGCWNEVLIFCSSIPLIKKCRNILSESYVF